VLGTAEAYTTAQSGKFWRLSMQRNGVKAKARRSNMLMVSIGWALVFSASVAAQTGGDPAKARMQEMDRRSLQLNKVGEDNVHATDPKRSQAMMEQVSEDFQRILTLHNEIVRSIAADRSLSPQFISDATGEIKRRSARLQTSLKLPKPEPTTEDRETRKNLQVMETKDELILLCKQIENFIKNPIIDQPGTIDAQQLEKARKDLQRVVELSDAIRKQVDKQKP
jgi:hypothetical protein